MAGQVIPAQEQGELPRWAEFLAIFGGGLMGSGVPHGLAQQDPLGGLALVAIGVLSVLAGLSRIRGTQRPRFLTEALTWVVIGGVATLTQTWQWPFWQQALAVLAALITVAVVIGSLRWGRRQLLSGSNTEAMR